MALLIGVGVGDTTMSKAMYSRKVSFVRTPLQADRIGGISSHKMEFGRLIADRRQKVVVKPKIIGELKLVLELQKYLADMQRYPISWSPLQPKPTIEFSVSDLCNSTTVRGGPITQKKGQWVIHASFFGRREYMGWFSVR